MTALRECVLVVDDEALVANLWCMILEDMSVEVCGTAPTAEAAIAMAQTHRPKVVLMDVRLRGRLDGVDAALVIHETVGSKVIFITGSRSRRRRRGLSWIILRRCSSSRFPSAC